MPLTERELEEVIYGSERFRRYTQDSPVMPDVWLEYGRKPDASVDLLITPHVDASAAELGSARPMRLADRSDRHLREIADEPRVAYNEAYVVAELTLDELIQIALPLSKWWQQYLWRGTLATGVETLVHPHVSNMLMQHAQAPVGSESRTAEEEATPGPRLADTARHRHPQRSPPRGCDRCARPRHLGHTRTAGRGARGPAATASIALASVTEPARNDFDLAFDPGRQGRRRNAPVQP